MGAISCILFVRINTGATEDAGM